MAEETVRVGDVVFAGDLVKVQHGTKYGDITYFDFDGNVSERHRLYSGFDMKDSSTARFLYWQTEKGNLSAGEPYDSGLEHDISAYAHIANDILATYHGNGATIVGSETFEDVNNIATNELYLSVAPYGAAMFRSFASYMLLDNMFDPILDAAGIVRYRLLGWKKNGIGDAFFPKTTIAVDQDIDLHAQWQKLAYLDLAAPSANGSPGALVSPSAYTYSYARGNALDEGTDVTVRAQPTKNFHLAKWTVKTASKTETVEKDYDLHNPAELSAYDLTMHLTEDTTITPTYDIDKGILDVATIGNNAKVDIVIRGNTTTVDAGESKELSVDWNSNVLAYALPKTDFQKFAYWTGDVNETQLTSSFLSFKIGKQLTKLSATFTEVGSYIVTTSMSLRNAGVIKHEYSESTAQNTIYPGGTSVKLSALLQPGISIKSWTVNGVVKIANGKPYTGIELDVTSDIENDYDVKLSVDTLLIDDADVPIVDNDGQPIDYSGSGWKD